LQNYRPKKLIIFSRDELKQHDMRQMYPGQGGLAAAFFHWRRARRDRLERAFHGVDLVIHAAALKQVPACEYNPFEAIQTNIMGAKNIIDAAIDQGVKKVVALSTDKAVNPVNLYGATSCARKTFRSGQCLCRHGRYAVL
jgi:UDP-N-acetylglucosamine 4,6-dehydratase